MIRVVSLQKWCREALCPHAFKNVEIRTEAGWRVDQHHRRRRPLECGMISSRRRSRTRLKVTRKPRLAAIIAGGAFAESCSRSAQPASVQIYSLLHARRQHLKAAASNSLFDQAPKGWHADFLLSSSNAAT